MLLEKKWKDVVGPPHYEETKEIHIEDTKKLKTETFGRKVMTSVSSSLNFSLVLKSCCLGDGKNAQDKQSSGKEEWSGIQR